MLKLLHIALALVPAYAQAQSEHLNTREIEGAIYRKYAVLDSSLLPPPLSVDFADYFPQWGFPPRFPSYITSVALQKKSNQDIRICYNVESNSLQITDIEKKFAAQRYNRGGAFDCAVGPITKNGVKIQSSYYKDIDISRIVVASSLPSGLSTIIPLRTHSASIEVGPTENQSNITVNSSLIQESTNCQTNYTGTILQIKDLFDQICDPIPPLEKANKIVTYGYQLKLESITNNFPFTVSGCTLEFNNYCVLQFGLPNNSSFKRNRFYSQRLIWKEYVYARTESVFLTDYVGEQYGIFGFYVK